MTTNEELADRILATLNHLAVLSRAGPKSWDRQRTLYRELFEMRRQLATEFGNRFGWKLSRASFAIGKLSLARIGERCDWWNDPFQRRTEFLDHAFFYRSPPARIGPLALPRNSMAASAARSHPSSTSSASSLNQSLISRAGGFPTSRRWWSTKHEVMGRLNDDRPSN